MVFFLVFSLAVNFCCCLREAFAENSQQSEHCHDQSGKADSGHSEDSHGCVCQTIFDSVFNQPFDAELTLAHFYKDFFKSGMRAVRYFDSPFTRQTFLLSDRSPPMLFASSIPIYLKISVLRI